MVLGTFLYRFTCLTAFNEIASRSLSEMGPEWKHFSDL